MSYRALADKLTNFLKPLQAIDAEDEAINGALAGSLPLFGEYMRGGYPNWATKYFLDALLLQERVRSSGSTEASKSAAPADHTSAQSMKRLDGIVERYIARFKERRGEA